MWRFICIVNPIFDKVKLTYTQHFKDLNYLHIDYDIAQINCDYQFSEYAKLVTLQSQIDELEEDF